jgi:hypothetical protein
MNYKVYTEGNYLIVKPVAEATVYEGPISRSSIVNLNSEKPRYRFSVLEQKVGEAVLANILKKDSSAYTQEEFDTLRFNIG